MEQIFVSQAALDAIDAAVAKKLSTQASEAVAVKWVHKRPFTILECYSDCRYLLIASKCHGVPD